jgi:hypothetical protein
VNGSDNSKKSGSDNDIHNDPSHNKTPSGNDTGSMPQDSSSVKPGDYNLNDTVVT